MDAGQFGRVPESTAAQDGNHEFSLVSLPNIVSANSSHVTLPDVGGKNRRFSTEAG